MSATAAAPRVIHSLPGRARVHLPALRNAAPGVVEVGLRNHPGVQQVRTNPLTGNVLIHFDPAVTDLEHLLGAAGTPGAQPDARRKPDHAPLDSARHPGSGPIVQSAIRLAAAAAGLGILTVRALTGSGRGGAGAVRVAGAITLLQGIPPVHNGLREMLGPGAADAALSLPKIAVLTFAGSPLGLVVAGAEALHLYTALREQRSASQRHEEQAEAVPKPGTTIRLEAGQSVPLPVVVFEGTGTAVGSDGLPIPVVAGTTLPPGARLHGGPFRVTLQGTRSSAPEPRPVPTATSLHDQYLRAIGPLSLAYAGATAVFTRSFDRTFAALLLLNPRAAMIGTAAADVGVAARVARSGAVVTGVRADRSIRLPDLLLFDGSRILTDGLELIGVVPISEEVESAEILAYAARVSAAAGSPWGGLFRTAGVASAAEGHFDGDQAVAEIDGVRFSLGPPEEGELPAAIRLEHRGRLVLLLRGERDPEPLGALILRPRLVPDAEGLVATCRRHNVEVALLGRGDPLAAEALADRLGMALAEGNALDLIRARQGGGKRVMFLSDRADAGAAFAACDLAVGISDRAVFPARIDVLTPDLSRVGATIEAAARLETSQRDAVGLSVAANLAGAAWGLRGQPDIARASRLVDGAALAALAVGRMRLRGGEPVGGAAMRIPDPRPERWGERGIEEVLRAFHSAEGGLTTHQAEDRRRAVPPLPERHPFLEALGGNLRSPLTAFVAAAAGLTVLSGARADAAVMGLTLAGNVLVGTWQEYRVSEVATALGRMDTATARILRDGQLATVPASEIVPGDILRIAPGDRLTADARVIHAEGLEVDEAALTGESLPVAKSPNGGSPANRILLEGSDVLVGHGIAVIVAVGQETRMGATAAALAAEDGPPSPLATRLSQLFRQVLPVTVAAGAIVTAGGLARGRPLLPELVTGASIALAALPEALPILAGMGQAAAARRLAREGALVRRPSAVEAMGRVDVACVDKTGTLTEGRLALRLIATCEDGEAEPSGDLSAELRHVLLTAALASPHPEAGDAASHSTDVAVMRGAAEAGLGDEMHAAREREARFDPTRPFHATLVGGRLRVKGAPEAIARRCTAVSHSGQSRHIGEAGQQVLLAKAQQLAERGLRVIMVAEGASDTPGGDPHELTALGFLGISDPLRPAVPTAVRRCHEAGIRVIMLTGDHPATARAVAREAGLLVADDEILTGAELAQLRDRELDPRLERVAVIARATPLDKLRIIESLRRRGHTIAMTGDGVNDAPALRLADVGFAMGRGGTEVARQAADVVLAEDDFASLTEALVEGRSFWRNLRRALGLLLGGNLGELGFMMVGSVFGLGATLTVRQILATNLITDALPAFAVAVQQPEHRHLAGLSREGTTALGKPLRQEILHRAVATATPALAACLIATRAGTALQSRSVGFATIVTTQLALTLDAGRAHGDLTRPVIGAVAASGGALLALLTVPSLRTFFDLVSPTPMGWALIGGSAIAAPLLSRVLPTAELNGKVPAALREPAKALPASPVPA